MFQTGRMLFERIENRVLVGIIAFVSIMVLVGWVAINENARMASFSRQYVARSIERGAGLFAANCTSCHGTDGLGGGGVAPGLNNPQFFGHDFIADTRKELNALNKQLTDLTAEKDVLNAELTTEGITEERKVAIATRLAEIEVSLADQTRIDRIAVLEAEKQAFADSVVAAIDLGYDVENPSRNGILGWNGTQEDLIITTLIHGRPTSGAYWPAAMPAWSQRAGAAMRDDQLQDITNYILNWDKGDGWTVEDLLSVKQFGIIPGQGGGQATAPAIGADVDAALTQVTALAGDPARGEKLYAGRTQTQASGGRLGCGGCHSNASQGPAYDGTYERVVSERLTLPQFAGYTVEHYLVESILAPGAFVVENYADGLMPRNYNEQVSAQDLADLLEYLKSTDPAYVAPTAP